MTPEQATELRKPFPAESIGKLPRAANKAAAEANVKGNCDVCGKYHVLPAIHLDYVGHAAVTDRLLAVDPDWSWKPMGIGPNGEPLVTNGGLWIELTVCGVTRPGFGDEANGRGMKEMIGDAIRNAAMRFGVALDLWAKEDLHASSNGSGAGILRDAGPERSPANPAPDETEYLAAAAAARLPGAIPSQVPVSFGKNKGTLLGNLTLNQLRWYAEDWKVQDEPSDYDILLKAAAVALYRGDDAPEALLPDPDADIPFE